MNLINHTIFSNKMGCVGSRYFELPVIGLASELVVVSVNVMGSVGFLSQGTTVFRLLKNKKKTANGSYDDYIVKVSVIFTYFITYIHHLAL